MMRTLRASPGNTRSGPYSTEHSLASRSSTPSGAWCSARSSLCILRCRRRCGAGADWTGRTVVRGHFREGGCVMDIGFIGLGTMGSRIAANLVKAGHKVRVWNRSRPSVDTLAALGATPVSTAREAFSGDAVFPILADDAAVRAVIEPLLEGAPKGLVHVNMATISIVLVRDLSARHREHGVSYVAATVFGRPELAAAGKLTIVAAGEPNAVARVQPLFDVIGQKTWPIGVQPE